jgi:hypothetical protein
MYHPVGGRVSLGTTSSTAIGANNEPVKFQIKSGTSGTSGFALRTTDSSQSYETFSVRDDGRISAGDRVSVSVGSTYAPAIVFRTLDNEETTGFISDNGEGVTPYIGVVSLGHEGWRFQPVGYSGPSSSFDFHSRGDIVAFSTVPSDERLKKDFTFFGEALDTVNQLNGYRFTWKHNNVEDIGFSAQEVEPLLPEIVKEKALPLMLDDGVLYKTVSYEKMVPVLLEAIKELHAIVKDQQTQINALKK